MYVLGIDASTTCTAVVLLENASKYDPKLHDTVVKALAQM